MFIKSFLLFVIFGAAGSLRSQDDGGVKITLPDINIIIGGNYDHNGYDRYGYDCNGYNRYGYDRYGYDCHGYDKYGYDKYGYDRAGYDRNGCDRNGYYRYYTTYYPKKHHDNGKHKGWYKNKHNGERDGKWKDHDGDRDDD
jgi:hypothetical protein